jgi:hypothetical protein
MREDQNTTREGYAMKTFLFGLILGLILANGMGIAQEWLDEPVPGPQILIPMSPIYPYFPPVQPLPPMPVPQWQHVNPC